MQADWAIYCDSHFTKFIIRSLTKKFFLSKTERSLLVYVNSFFLVQVLWCDVLFFTIFVKQMLIYLLRGLSNYELMVVLKLLHTLRF